MVTAVTVRKLDGKKLEGRAGRHTVITDRKPEDGGGDAGCTSGELLLLAIGSCACGGVRRFLQDRGSLETDFLVDVSFLPSPTGRERDMIRISVSLPAALLYGGEAALVRAVMDGRVVGRIALGSELEVCCGPEGDGARG